MITIMPQVALAAVALASATPEVRRPGPQAGVTVDSARHTVTLTLGDFRIEPAPAGYGSPLAMHVPHTATVEWPIDGWVRGISLRIADAQGVPLPKSLLHHLAIVNFGRRQLLKPTPERVVAFGRETGDMSLPRTVGIPMSRGMPLAITLGWHNATSTTYNGARVELVIDWIPASTPVPPLSVLPVSMDVVGALGEVSGYDLPRGTTRQSIAFEMPLDGRIIAAGGHLHDHGTLLQVDDVSSDRRRKVLALTSVRDDSGRVIEVSRITPGISGAGIRLHAGRRYELSALNENATGMPLPGHAMAYVAFLFAPARGSAWPSADTADPAWTRELQYLFGGHH